MTEQTKTTATDSIEEGVDVPYEQIAPTTLHALVEEFVSREWSELADSGYTHDQKVEQVMQQLRSRSAKIVYDLTSETCNIVPSEGSHHV
jgi:hypothetical protein